MTPSSLKILTTHLNIPLHTWQKQWWDSITLPALSVCAKNSHPIETQSLRSAAIVMFLVHLMLLVKHAAYEALPVLDLSAYKLGHTSHWHNCQRKQLISYIFHSDIQLYVTCNTSLNTWHILYAAQNWWKNLLFCCFSLLLYQFISLNIVGI